MKNYKQITLVFIVLFSTILCINAQDGAKLFKQNCAACHKIDAKLVGPQLKGAMAKWENAGEKELMYEWIASPTDLYETGKSKMAAAIWDFSPAPMSPLPHLTREEVDAIFAFADAPPVIEEQKKEKPKTPTKVIPTPSTPMSNGTLVFLLSIITFLIIAMLVLINGVKALKK